MSYIPQAKPWTMETAIETWRWVSRSLKTSGLVETTGSWKCFWLDTLFSVVVMVGRGTDKCPWDRADGKTDILHAAVKGPRGAESSQGHTFMLGMRAKCAETRCKWQRPPSPASGPHQSPGASPNQPSGPSAASKTRKCKGQPLYHYQADGETHTLFFWCHLQKKQWMGRFLEVWLSSQEIKYRDYLNTGRWTLNWKEASKSWRFELFDEQV